MGDFDKIIKNSDGFGGDKVRYCRKCGKPLVYSKLDEKGRENPFYEQEWEEKICHSCNMKERNKGGGKYKKIRGGR